VRDILAAVAERGDAAIREYTSRFDGVELDSLVVADAELAAAIERIEPDVRAALELAADRIAAYQCRPMSGWSSPVCRFVASTAP
jgi:histidinol dehydrogenase